MKILIIFIFFIFSANHANAHNIVNQINGDVAAKKRIKGYISKIYKLDWKKHKYNTNFNFCDIKEVVLNSQWMLDCVGEDILCVISYGHLGDYKLQYSINQCMISKKWLDIAQKEYQENLENNQGGN